MGLGLPLAAKNLLIPLPTKKDLPSIVPLQKFYSLPTKGQSSQLNSPAQTLLSVKVIANFFFFPTSWFMYPYVMLFCLTYVQYLRNVVISIAKGPYGKTISHESPSLR